MLKPKKQLGQNFLINEQIADQIADEACLESNDVVIEVGPGLGVLTERLVKKAGQVYAIEKDFDLIQKLKRNLGDPKNLKIVHQDALLFDLSLFGNYKVVANIPYNITSPLIRKFLEAKNKPDLIVLMVQKEVAERIVAKPGNRDRGLLTLIVEFYADSEIVFEVNRKNFFPVPSVDSAVIKLKARSEKFEVDEKVFFRLVKAGFSSKRRQIHNSLAATLQLDKDTTEKLLKEAGINSMDRAEDLTMHQWLYLYKAFQILIQKITI